MFFRTMETLDKKFKNHANFLRDIFLMAMRFHKNIVRGKYLLVRDLDARQIAVIPMFNNYKVRDMLNKLGFSYLIFRI